MKNCPTCQRTYPDDFTLCPRDGAPLATAASETEAQLAAGLARRFRLVRRLGQGGMGTVFLAEQIGVGNRPVALKVLNRKLLDAPEFLLRFQNEAGSTGRIHHPNVVTIYESAQADDGTPYIAMEFLEGESLRELMTRRGALPVAEVVEIIQQVADGLDAAHELAIIHRDLKPDNIFLTQDKRHRRVVKVVDFGIAKLRESGAHTQTGMVLGTPAYMSYEQASGMKSDDLDARSDVYSLGVVVYEMLTGRVPFHSDTPVGYLRKHLMDDPPPFRAIAPGLGVPPAVESAVLKALVKDRDQRYATALDFASEFGNAASAPSQAEVERRGREKEAAELAARQNAEQERQARERAEAERREREKVAAEQALRQRAEQDRLARERAEAERRERDRAAELAGREKVEQDRLAREAEAARREREMVAAMRTAPRPSSVVARPLQFQTPPQPSNKLKIVAIVVVALILGVAAVWYASSSSNPAVETPRPTVATPAARPMRDNPKDGLKYVWIPSGTFMMGCSPWDSECQPEEKPPHQVTITKGFWMGQTPVTVGVYKRFAGTTGRQMRAAPNFNNGWANENMPIVDVTWDDAQAYCGWVGGRLPTEAEWEYAARAGSTEARYGSLDEVAWYNQNSGGQTHDVAQKRANGFGLYDMLGNVWEWVNDRYDQNYYRNSPSQDPSGAGSGPLRVLRGGSWGDDPRGVRVSGRDSYDPGDGNDYVGFRCGGEVFVP